MERRLQRERRTNRPSIIPLRVYWQQARLRGQSCSAHGQRASLGQGKQWHDVLRDKCCRRSLSRRRIFGNGQGCLEERCWVTNYDAGHHLRRKWLAETESEKSRLTRTNPDQVQLLLSLIPHNDSANTWFYSSDKLQFILNAQIYPKGFWGFGVLGFWV